MHQRKITTDSYGRLSSDSRHQIRSLIESRGGLIGKHLAAVVLPEIERQIQRHVEAHPRPIRIMRIAKSFGSTLLGRANGFDTPTPGMNMRLLESSSLRRVGYSQTSRTMRIEFKAGGIWDYFPLPPSEHEGLMKAGSHGRYFYSRIKGRYSCRKIAG